MENPRKIASKLESEMDCERVEWSRMDESHVGNVYGYRYHVFIDERRLNYELRADVSKVSDKVDTILLFNTIEPVIEQTESSIQAMMKVNIEERKDRRKIENKSLTDYE